MKKVQVKNFKSFVNEQEESMDRGSLLREMEQLDRKFQEAAGEYKRFWEKVLYRSPLRDSAAMYSEENQDEFGFESPLDAFNVLSESLNLWQYWLEEEVGNRP
jgi:hypothetical protein